MTCQRIRIPAMTLYEAKELGGSEHGFPVDKMRREGDRLVRRTDEEMLAEAVAIEHATVLPQMDNVWMCGAAPPEPQCECGRIADLLCDYPIGRGKTCDLGLCPEHAFAVAEEKHLCLLHHAEFRGKAKVDRINPWPPVRGSR
jgi:hypothetical protein